MHEASALLFRTVDSAGMGGADVSTSGPSSAAVSGLKIADPFSSRDLQAEKQLAKQLSQGRYRALTGARKPTRKPLAESDANSTKSPSWYRTCLVTRLTRS